MHRKSLLVLIVSLLLDQPVMADEVPRIMQFAIANGDVKLLGECLSTGLPVDGLRDYMEPYDEEQQWSSLALAVAWKQPGVVDWLLDHGADRRKRITYERIALDLAVESGDEAMCRLLAEPERTDSHLQHGIPRDVWDNFIDFAPLNVPLLFLQVGDKDASEILQRMFQQSNRKGLPASRASSSQAHAGKLKDNPVVFWFKDTKTGVSGSRLSITTKQPALDEWLIEGKLEGRPAPGIDLSVPMSSETLRVRQRYLHGRWIVQEPAPNLVKKAPAKPAVKNRHDFLWPDVDSFWGMSPGHLRLLLQHGLEPLKRMGEPLNHNAFLKIAFSNSPRTLKALLDVRPDLAKEKALWREAAQDAYQFGHWDVLKQLALKPDEQKVGGFHRAAIEVLFSQTWQDSRFKHCFVTFNDASPAAEIMAVIRQQLPGSRPWSEAEEGNFTDSSYRLAKTKEEGWKIEATLTPTDNGYSFKLRQMTGPFLAGGGTAGSLILTHGHWLKANTTGWDE